MDITLFVMKFAVYLALFIIVFAVVFEIYRAGQKERACQLCKGNSTRIHRYNTQALYEKEGKRSHKYVCTKCLMNLIKDDLEKFGGRAVFTEPIIELYGFEKLKDCTFPEEQGKPLSTYLPPAFTTCNKCKSYAKYGWVSKNSIDDDKSIKTNAYLDKDNNSEYEYLCSAHLIETFINAIKKNKIIFKDIYPVRGSEDGICI